jgi:hypothetical protein
MFTQFMKWASVAVLLAAVSWHPSLGYALIMQLVVCITAIMVGAQSFRMRKAVVATVFMLVAALFNPILPVGLSRTMFVGVGTVSLALFLFSILTFRQQPRLSVASITDRTPGSESL